MREEDVELQLLVRRHSEIVADQTRRATRVRDLLPRSTAVWNGGALGEYPSIR